jgi:hypothetical protein
MQLLYLPDSGFRRAEIWKLFNDRIEREFGQTNGPSIRIISQETGYAIGVVYRKEMDVNMVNRNSNPNRLSQTIVGHKSLADYFLRTIT